MFFFNYLVKLVLWTSSRLLLHPKFVQRQKNHNKRSKLKKKNSPKILFGELKSREHDFINFKSK